MKKVTLVSMFLVLFAGYLVNTADAQQTAPVNFCVFEEMVAPSDLAAFSKVQQQVVDLWKKLGFDLPIYCYGTDDNTFYWVVPIQNFASIDNIFAKSGEITKKMKSQEGFDGEKAFRDLSTSRSSVIRWVPELSYHPDGKFGQQPDKPYCEWGFCSIKAGHEREAANAITKFVDFYKKNNENYEWDVYNVDFGYDTPMMIIMTRWKDAVSLRQTEAELWKKYGKDFDQLWNDFAQHVRKMDNKTGWFKPEWSINMVQ